MKLSRFSRTAFTLALLALGGHSTSALAFPFSGTFAEDDDYQFFTFTLSAPATVTLQTTSYTTGGFVPYLHVWDSTGLDLGGATPTNSDASYPVNLGAAGTYYVGLTVANNVATGDFPGSSTTPVADVFNHNGLGNFTISEFSCLGTGPFWGQNCDHQRTGTWALNITGVVSASLWPANNTNPTPEPSTLALGLVGAAAFSARRRRATQA
jgi:hypothetical protein